MFEPYFKDDSYDTPSDVRGFFMDRLFFKTRIYFFWQAVTRVIMPARRLCLRGEYDDHAWCHSSYTTIKILERFGGRVHLSGLNKLKEYSKPVVFISNHMSTIETYVLPCLIAPHMQVTFVVKQSLMTFPLFGTILQSRDPIVVLRQNPREDLKTVLEKGKEKLDQGISVIIFPQSTRSHEFKPEEFNSLGIKLAKKAGVDVVPIALKTDYLRNGKHLREFGPLDRKQEVHFAFGEAMQINGNGKQQHEQIVEFIKARLQQWNNQPSVIS